MIDFKAGCFVMPRQAREKSSSGVYHIMLRGINKQDIFYDEEDKLRCIETLNKYKNICSYKVYGYCLMSNHIHLLLREGKETISQTMKRIGVSYVYWYNMKYERVGHLFQDRYRSEKVEDDKYLLTVLRYIHHNPVRAGMVDELAQYKWSSYSEYVRQESTLTDIEFVFELLSNNCNKRIEIFKEFMSEENMDKHLDDGAGKRRQMSDEEAKKLIQKMIGSDNLHILQQKSRNERDDIIKKLKEKEVSIRQLARITGIGRRIIEKA